MNSGTEETTSQVPDMQVPGISEPRKADGPQASVSAKVSGITQDALNKKIQAGVATNK